MPSYAEYDLVLSSLAGRVCSPAWNSSFLPVFALQIAPTRIAALHTRHAPPRPSCSRLSIASLRAPLDEQ